MYASFRSTHGAGPVFQLVYCRTERGARWQAQRDGVPLGERSSLGAAMAALEYEVCTEILNHRGRLFSLHGATVAGPGGHAVITGYSESGKTTLTLALAARGYAVGGDDVALLDPETGLLHPLPRCAHVDDRSQRFLRRAGLRISHPLARRYRFITPPDLGGPLPPAPARVVVLLVPGEGAAPVLTPMPQAEATLTLLREAGWEEEQTPAALAAVARLAGGAACYRLTRGRLRAMADIVANLLGPPPQSQPGPP